MDQSKGALQPWVDLQRLPQVKDFRFTRPGGMATDDCYMMASWIVKGEIGLLKPQQIFRWQNQPAGPPPKKLATAAQPEYVLFSLKYFC